MTALRTLSRRLGSIMLIGGLLLVAYAVLVVAWRDPFTSAYTAYEQHEMRGTLRASTVEWTAVERTLAAGEPATPTADPAAAARATVRRAHVLAARFARSTRGRTGRPIGRIEVPRIGLSTIVVENTDYWGSLSKGPGRYERGDYPGLGETTGIAGHRTTFEAPFRHIDGIRDGDPITVHMPYGDFTYRVLRHRIVDDGDWSIVRRVGFDELVLSACHPLYSASQRYVVFARLAKIALPGAKPVALPVV